MKKYIVFASFAALASLTAQWQQLQTSSFYDMQGVLHNPSVAGVQTNRSIKSVIGPHTVTSGLVLVVEQVQ